MTKWNGASSMTNGDHALHREIQAADVLRQTLREIVGDDEEVIRDTIEGETSLRELIAMTAADIAADIGLVKGADEAIKAIKERKDRIEKRIAMRRVAVQTGMESAGIKTLETAVATLSLKAVPPSVLILDEAAIPSEFWEPQDPKLSKRAVLDALKAGEDVPGAQLSNGGTTLQFRS